MAAGGMSPVSHRIVVGAGAASLPQLFAVSDAPEIPLKSMYEFLEEA